MLGYEERATQAKDAHNQGLKVCSTTPVPNGQKFPPGTRVRIAKDLGSSMSHFPSDRPATVEHTYAHAYGGNDVKSYSLHIDGLGSTAWYGEDQLKLEDLP